MDSGSDIRADFLEYSLSFRGTNFLAAARIRKLNYVFKRSKRSEIYESNKEWRKQELSKVPNRTG